MIKCYEEGFQDSALGKVLHLKIYTEGHRRLFWGEVWAEFSRRYPGQWAVQVSQPENQLVDGKNVAHLWVMDECPQGLNLAD